MKNIIILSVLSIFFICGCHTTKKTEVTPESIVSKMQNKYPNYSAAELTRGSALYQQYCGTCHELKNTTSLDEAGWTKIVPPMVDKVNEKGLVINAAQQQLILKYVVTMTTFAEKK